MNSFIRAQIINITTMATSFKEGCHLGAWKDDGKLSKEEEKLLRKIDETTDRFIRELAKLK